SKVPPHAHVTEVARIDKRFVDCGGTLRLKSACHLQAWFQDDTDHRLTAGKLLGILEKAAPLLETEELEVEVEYEAPFIALFPLEMAESAGGDLMISLGIKHTACLAENKCLPPKLNKLPLLTELPEIRKSKCC